MTDEEIIVRTAAEFTKDFSRSCESGRRATHVIRMEPSRGNTATGARAATKSCCFRIQHSSIRYCDNGVLQAGKGDGAARARLQGFQGNVIGNLLAFKSH